ncbi:MAG: DUF309 domain-containing protein [Candidatus Zixiibacteriota bacterium]
MVEGFDEDSTAEPLAFVAEGIRLFSIGHYFEAHDVWEELWQRLRGPDRLYLQGLIHIAVGAYHHANGNLRGARSQWGKARRKIAPYPPCHWGIDTGDWMRFFEQVESRPEISDLPGALRFESARFPTDLSVAQA